MLFTFLLFISATLPNSPFRFILSSLPSPVISSPHHITRHFPNFARPLCPTPFPFSSPRSPYSVCPVISYRHQSLPEYTVVSYRHQSLPEYTVVSYRHQSLPEYTVISYTHQSLPEYTVISYRHQSLPEYTVISYTHTSHCLSTPSSPIHTPVTA